MNLERAIEIAVTAHKGQTDKAGHPYILHPLKVMMALHKSDDKIVGVLHDVVEDCEGWTFDRLKNEGFSDKIVEAVKAVTQLDPDESYPDFILRCQKNHIGRRVKIADITDNLDIRRIDTITDRDVVRITKYKTAMKVLVGEA